MGQRSIDVRGRQFLVRTGRHDPFWDLFCSGSWEPETLGVLERRLRTGTQFIDVGAWIGPLSLVAATLGSRVRAFEPDPIAHAELVANLALNPELEALVTVDRVAVGSESGTMTMVGGEDGLGASVSRVVASGRRDQGGVLVPVVAVASLLDTAPFLECDLLKIDIEGGEYDVVPALRAYLRSTRVPFLLSLHGGDLRGRPVRAPRSAHVLRLRSVQAIRRLAVFRNVASYPRVHEVRTGAGVGWSELSAFEKLRIATRLDDTQLYCCVDLP